MGKCRLRMDGLSGWMLGNIASSVSSAASKGMYRACLGMAIPPLMRSGVTGSWLSFQLMSSPSGGTMHTHSWKYNERYNDWYSKDGGFPVHCRGPKCPGKPP